jgi:hypothetical protein
MFHAWMIELRHKEDFPSTDNLDDDSLYSSHLVACTLAQNNINMLRSCYKSVQISWSLL